MKQYFFIFFIFLSSCGPMVEIEHTDDECVTSVHCPDGYFCLDNKCIHREIPDNSIDPEDSEEICDSDIEFDESSVEMVKVPAGTFWMGCNDSTDAYCDDYDKPYKKVYLDEFFIDKYEVTAAQYEKCVDACICEPSHTGSGCNFKTLDYENHPINCINWYKADSYCRWAGKRLPTEAQWEKAARGGCELYDYCEYFTPAYPWKNDGLTGCEHAVFSSCDGTGTQPVGSLDAGKSPYGCYDMIGNVSEWVNDWWDYYDGSQSPSINPQGPDSGTQKVMRGCGWNNSLCKSYHRMNRELDSSHGSEGFRCAKSTE